LFLTYSILLLFLAPQSSLGLSLLHKIRLNFLEASQQFSCLHGRVVSPMPNPHLGSNKSPAVISLFGYSIALICYLSYPCALTEHHFMKVYWENEGMSPLILYPGTRCR
jgi:hypothetical protein